MGHFTTTSSRRNALWEHVCVSWTLWVFRAFGYLCMSSVWYMEMEMSFIVVWRLWSQHPHTSNEYLSLSLSLSELPPQPPVNHSFRYAPLVTQDMLAHSNDRLHQATHTRTYTVKPNYWFKEEKASCLTLFLLLSLSMLVYLFKSFSLIFSYLILGFCGCLPLYSFPVCLTLFLFSILSLTLVFLSYFPPCLSLSLPTFLLSFPLLVCLNFFLSLSLFLLSHSHFHSMSVSLSFALTIFLSSHCKKELLV